MNEKHPPYDLSQTRCFTDADGCLFDSLRYCNVVLDKLFKGKLTDKPYTDYYQDFGDAYEIIPGSPWRTILQNLVEYHTIARAEREGDDPDGDKLFEAYISNLAWVARDVEPGETVDSTETELLGELVTRFENELVALFESMDYDDFAIDPVIRFCRAYRDAGGTLIIHSGTNEKILLSMLRSAGIEDLFDDYLCTDMMTDADEAKMGKWGYKTELLSRLLAKYPVNGMKDFVLGDTKGDGYGAYEVGLPFALTWRGYPKDPTRLIGSDGEALTPNFIFDTRPELMNELDGDEAARRCEELLAYAQKVSSGSESAPIVKR